MPHKFNTNRRSKIPKQKYRVTNWAEYNKGLRRRGDLTVWISDAALGMWSAARRTTRGGQPRYSDLAIELCLTLGMLFKQPLRQTQGFMRGIAEILVVEIAVPDFSTLSHRGNGVILQTGPRADKQAAIHLVVDSTGLKIFGEGEWLEKKHKTKRKRLSWRKLHLGLGLVSGEIVSSELTTDDVGDPTALPGLLDQVDGPVDLFLADGAYDGEPTSELLATRFGSTIEVTIPPPKNAILSPNAAKDPTERDSHGPPENSYWTEAKGAQLRKSENNNQDWRSGSQPNNRPWPPKFPKHRLNSVSGRALSELTLIYATTPNLS
jgi:hypothetical protein